MKTCSRCKETKPTSDYTKSGRSKDGLHAWCRACKRLRYLEERDVVIARTKKRAARVRKTLKKLIIETKSNPCKDCGKSYPYYVMDFDHLRDKEFNLSQAVRQALSVEKVLREIEKCEVVCSNCHRERTFSRLCIDSGFEPVEIVTET